MNKLQITIFSAWLAGALIAAILLLGATTLFGQTHVGGGATADALTKILVIWLTPLGCFAGLWFPNHERPQRLSISRPKRIAAYSLTLVSQLILLALVAFAALGNFEHTVGVRPGDPLTDTFQDRIDILLRTAAVLSPVGSAPVVWLTSVGAARAARGRSKKAQRSQSELAAKAIRDK